MEHPPSSPVDRRSIRRTWPANLRTTGTLRRIDPEAATSARRINVADLVVSLVLILVLFATCLFAYLGLMIGSTPFRWASPPVITTVALIATILVLVWRRIAFWIPLAGIAAIVATQVVGTMLAGAGPA